MDTQAFQLDYLEIEPASSKALKDNVREILDQSRSYSAAIAGHNNKTGEYEIVIKGKLTDEAAASLAPKM